MMNTVIQFWQNLKASRDPYDEENIDRRNYHILAVQQVGLL